MIAELLRRRDVMCVGDARRGIPATGSLLSDPEIEAACRRLGRESVLRVIRDVQDECRSGQLAITRVYNEVLRRLPANAGGLRPVINATGVIVHTNLGRAPLSDAATHALTAAAGATDVELDLRTGARSPRGRSALAALSYAVPEAGGVHVVNNGAAALALCAASLASGQTIVVARGELVEIGDGFRIPELLAAAGGRLREVGTTNRVRLSDYAEAIDDETGCVLKVHPSNFVVSGFTSSVETGELAGLPVPIVVDIGSGLLNPHPILPAEPDAASALKSGADLVTCSGDKLLGGPQCGLILGHSDLVQRIRRHPLARAYRVDKLTLAALEATLTGPPSPVERALRADRESLRLRASDIVATIADVVAAEVAHTDGAVGGGGAPGVAIPSAAVALPGRLAAALRRLDPAVVGRVHRGRLLIDLLAVDPRDDACLAEQVRRAVTTAPRDEDSEED